ncbi:pyridine nucleotide-disulfide oxidoreductase [Gemmatimonadetes bacterium T265]|nr:pyridine nucleotide-disulfide oxidoreductase [Gemmatimonadetes bacterium T265]
MTRRLVLVGGGHAHLEVLRAAAARPFAAELVLVSPYARQVYSGMMPAELRGVWDESALAVDLPALCRAAGARFVEGAAVRLDVSPHAVAVHAAGATLAGDLLSLDVGAAPAALDVPGAREHAYRVRPLAAWRALVARLAALAVPDDGPLACCVVGGGAAGVELSLAVVARAGAAGRGTAVTVVEGGPALLPSWGRQADRVRRLLERRGVRVRTGTAVVRVGPDAVTLADRTRVPSALTVWVPGAAALPLAREAGLPVDDRGYLRVDATLRAADGSPVWGAGDGVALAGAAWVPKAGVYAVREAPVLAHNLRVAADGSGDGFRRYTPQRHFLAALDTADGRAFVRWRGVTSHSRAALALKRAIDLRFVRRYQAVYQAVAGG